MTLTQIITRVQRIVDDAGGNRSEAARKLGVSPQYLHDFLNERRKPGKKILAAIGVRKIVSYVKAAP